VPESNPEFEAAFGGNPAGDMPSPDEESWAFDPSEAVEFARLVPGTYHADIVERPEKKYSQQGNPMMVVKFFVTDQEFYGATPTRRFMLSGKGGGWTKEFLKAIGLPDEAEGKKPIVPTQVQGRRCMIKTDWQKNQDGSISDEWTDVVKCSADPQGHFIGDSTLDVGV
jgi:hypothetical protein